MQEDKMYTDFYLVKLDVVLKQKAYLVLSHYLAKAQCTLPGFFMALGAKCDGTVIVS